MAHRLRDRRIECAALFAAVFWSVASWVFIWIGLQKHGLDPLSIVTATLAIFGDSTYNGFANVFIFFSFLFAAVHILERMGDFLAINRYISAIIIAPTYITAFAFFIHVAIGAYSNDSFSDCPAGTPRRYC